LEVKESADILVANFRLIVVERTWWQEEEEEEEENKEANILMVDK
jgi:hypothetical protein